MVSLTLTNAQCYRVISEIKPVEVFIRRSSSDQFCQGETSSEWRDWLKEKRGVLFAINSAHDKPRAKRPRQAYSGWKLPVLTALFVYLLRLLGTTCTRGVWILLLHLLLLFIFPVFAVDHFIIARIVSDYRGDTIDNLGRQFVRALDNPWNIVIAIDLLWQILWVYFLFLVVSVPIGLVLLYCFLFLRY